MFNRFTKIIALILVCAIAFCNLVACDMFAEEECNHEYGEWEVRKAPTCTEKGENFKVCEKCGKEKTKSISKLDHDFDSNDVCKNCGIKEGEIETPSGNITIPTSSGNRPDEHPTERPTGNYPTDPPVEYPTDTTPEEEYFNIYLNSPVNVSAQYSHHYTYLVFVPEENGQYVFRSYDNYYQGTYLDTYGNLLDSNKIQLVYNDDGGYNNNFYIDYYLEAGVTYYLAVANYTGYDTQYAVIIEKYSAQPEYIDIGVGSIMDVDIRNSYDVKKFSFTPTENGPYTFYGTSYDYIDSYGSLFDESGEVIQSADSGAKDGHFCITEYLYVGQTYYFEASLWGSSTGSYELHLDGFSDLTLYYSRSSYADSIGEYFRFIPEESGTYLFYAYNNYGYGSYIDNYAVLLDSNLNYLTEDDDGAGDRNFAISYALEAGQTYYLLVNDSSDYEANYCYYVTAELEPEYIDIDVNDKVWVDIGTSYEVKRFRFVPTESGQYTFFAESYGESVDSYGTLLDAYGNEITSNDSSGYNGNFCITEYLTAGETYYIEAKMWSSLTGSYDFCVEGVEYMYTGDYNIVRADRITESFKFVPEVSGIYVFYAYNNYVYDSYIDNYATLLDADFGYLTSDDDTGVNNNFYIDYYLEAGQTYYLNVEESSYAQGGNYYITVELYDDTSLYTDLYVGEMHTVNIDTSYNTVLFKFVPMESGPYLFYSESYGNYVDTYGSLFDENNNVIISEDSGGPNGNFCIIGNLTAGETYYFEARMYGSSTGTFDFAVKTYDTMYTSSAYRLYGDGIGDIFKFVPYESGSYTFYSYANLDDYGGYIDTYAMLVDGDFEYMLTENDDGDECENFKFSYYLEAGETYYLYVTDSYNYSNPYYVMVQMGSDEPEVPEVYVGDNVYINIANSYDRETYKFVPTATGIYTFYGESYGNYVDSYGTLLDANGDVITNEDGGGQNGNFCIIVYLIEGETYYIEAHMWGSDTGSYDLYIDGCEQIGPGYTVEVYSNCIGEWFTFIPSESGDYRFYAYNNENYGVYVDNYANLYNSNTDWLTGDDNGGDNYNFDFTIYLEAGQTYYLIVNDYTNTSSYYSFCIENVTEG